METDYAHAIKTCCITATCTCIV